MKSPFGDYYGIVAFSAFIYLRLGVMLLVILPMGNPLFVKSL